MDLYGFCSIFTFSEIDLQNRRLQRELRQKEATIDELKLRIMALERKLDMDSNDALDQGKFNFHVSFAQLKTN